MTSHFRITPPYPCSYLADRQARSVFVSPDISLTTPLYASLIQHGFRRSGNHVYTPHCDACNACQSLRVIVSQFSPSRSQRRVLQRNKDLTTHFSTARYTEERYALFERYLEQRHDDGDMYPTSPENFKSFLLSEWCNTYFLDLMLDDKLVGCATIDYLPSGLSAVYSFFEPSLEDRSLGVYSVLWQIQKARELKLSHVYLGYQIDECKKMNYKSRFKPHERFVNEAWR